jgi:hypothetical protein
LFQEESEAAYFLKIKALANEEKRQKSPFHTGGDRELGLIAIVVCSLEGLHYSSYITKFSLLTRNRR